MTTTQSLKLDRRGRVRPARLADAEWRERSQQRTARQEEAARAGRITPAQIEAEVLVGRLSLRRADSLLALIP